LLVDRKLDSDALTEAQKFLSKYPQHPNFNDVEKIKTSLETKLSSNP